MIPSATAAAPVFNLVADEPHQVVQAIPSIASFQQALGGSRTAWDRLFLYLVENNILNKQGDWVCKAAPPLPSLDQPQLIRLHKILETPYLIQAEKQYGGVSTASITIKKLLLHFSTWDIELIGSGAAYVLGKEFFKKFLLDLKVPEDLLPDALFSEMAEIPQDFDWRLRISEHSEDTIQAGSIELLSWLYLKLGTRPNFKKRWLAPKGHPSQYAISTFTLYHKPKPNTPLEAPLAKAFDLDILFVDTLEREALQSRDSFKIKLSLQPDLQYKYSLSSHLNEIREALAHFITRVTKIENLNKVNETGLPISITGTTKGRFPLSQNLFPALYEQSKTRGEQAQLAHGLKKAITTHSKANFSLFAAVFNAATFLGNLAFQEIAPALCTEENSKNSFLGKCCQKAVALKDIFYLQNLINLHAAIGLGNNIAIFEKSFSDFNHDFIELHCRIASRQKPLCLFLKNDLAASLKSLAHKEAWPLISDLSAEWLKEASLEGIFLPNECQDGIDELSTLESIPAKSLSFLLRLKWHKQYPTDSNIQKNFIHFTHLLPLITPKERLFFSKHFFSTFYKASGTYPLGTISFLEKKLETIYARASLHPHDIAHILYGTQNAELKKIAFKLISKYDGPLRKGSLSWLKDSINQSPTETFALFLKKYVLYNPLATWPIFTKLLVHPLLEQNISLEKERIISYLRWILQARPAAKDLEQLKEIFPLLQKIAPYSANSFAHLLSNQAGEQDAHQNGLELLQKEIEEDKGSKNTQKNFLYYLEYSYKEEDRASLQALCSRFIEKLAEKKESTLQQSLNFFSDAKVLNLFSDSDQAIDLFIKTFDWILSAKEKEQTFLSLALAKVLSRAKTINPTYIKGVGLFSTLLQKNFLQLPSTARTPLKSLLEIIISFLADQGHVAVIPLLNTCFLIGVDLQIDSKTAVKIAQFITTQDLQSKEAFIEAENGYSILLKNYGGKEAEYGEKGALFFVPANLKYDNPQKVLLWIKKIQKPDPCLSEAAITFSSKKYWNEHKELLDLAKEFLDQKFLAQERLKFAQEESNPLRDRATIYLEDHQLFLNEGNEELLLYQIKNLVDGLSRSPFPRDMELALQLLISLKSYVAKATTTVGDELDKKENSWDLVLTSLSKCASKKRIAAAWQALEIYRPHILFSTYLNLVRTFSDVHFYHSSFLALLNAEHFQDAVMNRGATNCEIKEVQQLLFFHALTYPKEMGRDNIDFKMLDQHRVKCIPNYSQLRYVQEWIAHSTPDGVLACLKALQEQASKEELLLPLSLELIDMIVKVVIPSKDFAAYQYALNVLEQKGQERLISQAQLEKLLKDLLWPSFAEAIKLQDKKLALAAFKCLLAHRDCLLSSFREIKNGIYEDILRAFSLLLTSDLPLEVLEVFYEKLIKEVLTGFKIPIPGAAQKIQIHFEYNVVFIYTLLKTSSTTNETSLLFLLKVVLDHLNFLLKNSKMGAGKCLFALRLFFYSHLFSSRPDHPELQAIEDLHQKEVHALIDKIKKEELFVSDLQALVEFEILREHKHTPRAEQILGKSRMSHPQTALTVLTYRVVGRLLTLNDYSFHISPSKLKLASLIFKETKYCFHLNPKESFPIMAALIDEMPNFEGSMKVKLDFMADIRMFLRDVTTWKAEARILVPLYFKALHSLYFKALESTPDDLRKIYFSAVITADQMRQNELLPKDKIELLPEDKEAYENTFLLLFKIASNYRFQVKEKDLVTRTMLNALQELSNESENKHLNQALRHLLVEFIDLPTPTPLNWLIEKLLETSEKDKPDAIEYLNVQRKRAICLGEIIIFLYENKFFEVNPSYGTQCMQKLLDNMPEDPSDFIKLSFFNGDPDFPRFKNNPVSLKQIEALQNWIKRGRDLRAIEITTDNLDVIVQRLIQSSQAVKR